MRCPICGGELRTVHGPNGHYIVCGACLFCQTCFQALVGLMVANRGVFERLKNL
jgi:ssDNA-binding Zn-finger/Zn-ribbon topoisomerase 1